MFVDSTGIKGVNLEDKFCFSLRSVWMGGKKHQIRLKISLPLFA